MSDTKIEMIDDQFWLKYAIDHATNAKSSRDAGAEKLETLIIWLWGIYTASFTIGTSLQALESPSNFVTILLASPIFLLILSYWFCIWVQLPVSYDKFDPRIPDDIVANYNKEIERKTRRLTISLSLVLASGISIAGALTIMTIEDKKISDTNPVVEDAQEAFAAKIGEDKKSICISAQLPKNKVYLVEIDTMVNESKKANLFFLEGNTLESGLVNLNVPIKKIPKLTRININWNEDSKSKGFSTRLKNN